jgi:hypothetical protein
VTDAIGLGGFDCRTGGNRKSTLPKVEPVGVGDEVKIIDLECLAP